MYDMLCTSKIVRRYIMERNKKFGKNDILSTKELEVYCGKRGE